MISTRPQPFRIFTTLGWCLLTVVSLSVTMTGCTDDSGSDNGSAADTADTGGDSQLPDGDLPGDLVGDTGNVLSDAPVGDIDADGQDTSVDLNLPPIPANADPCSQPEHWPLSMASERFPFVVHHRPGETATATEVVALLERAWEVEVLQLGFSPPVDDAGLCGEDGGLDVFLWAGIVESYVDVVGDVPETAWFDQRVFMVVDAWGAFGGEQLDVTVAHEFNHACQAADDWWERPPIFEMTATFIEEVVHDDDNSFVPLLEDFQDHPDWALDYDDEYETWYMYGASMYLIFLQEHFFEGDASFVAEMWRGLRSPPWDSDPADNEPDYQDALDTLLTRDVGMTFFETIPVFARWRWYTGTRDDGAHFSEGATLPEVAWTATAQVDSEVEVSVAPMLLGTAYISVSSARASQVTVNVTDDALSQVQWVFQALPGSSVGTDGVLLEPVRGRFTLDLIDGERGLVVTALPSGSYDADERSDSTHNLQLVFSP